MKGSCLALPFLFRRCFFASLLVLLCGLLLGTSSLAHAQVPQGGSGTVNRNGYNAPSGYWQILLSGSTVASNTSPNGWSTSYNSGTQQFTVTAPSSATISTAYEVRQYVGSAVSGTFSVVAGTASLSSVSVTPNPVTQGVTCTGTVQLTSNAPSGGLTVTLSSSNTNLVTVPASVTVASGSNSATFSVTTIDTFTISTPTAVTVTAVAGGVTKTTTLTVHPKPMLGPLILGAAGPGGISVSARATLDRPIYGMTVTVVFSDTHPAATISGSVTINSGQSYADGVISTTPVAVNTAGTIRFDALGDYRTANLTVYAPQVGDNGLSVSPNPVYGGDTLTASVTLDGAAPTGGWTLTLTCSPANTLAKWNGEATDPSGLPQTLTIPAGSTTASMTLIASTVGTPTNVTVSLTEYPAAAKTLTILPKHLRVTDIFMPNTLKLEWDDAAQGTYHLKRDGVTIATLNNTVRTYNDSFAFVDGQTYLYELYDVVSMQPAKILSREKIKAYKSNASGNQTVDSRIDPRYSTIVYKDYKFGNQVYRGGLFVGFVGDGSKTGRSFVKFPLATYPTQAAMRAGTLNLYFTGAVTNGTTVANVDVGYQPVTSDTWDAANLVWTTAPTVNPAQSKEFTTLTYNPTNPTASQKWYRWKAAQDIKSVFTGDQVLTAAFTGLTDTTSGWAYFAKSQFSSGAYTPAAMHVWNVPVPVLLWIKYYDPQTVNNVTTYKVRISVFVNVLDPGQTAAVSISPNNETVTVTSVDRIFEMPGRYQYILPSSWQASLNSVTVDGVVWP